VTTLAKPEYCTQNNGNCKTCSLVNYGRDCRNNPIPTKRVPVLLTEPQYEALRRISYEQHTPMAELIRQAIDAWLKNGKEKK
jgi:hypothetical protein